MRVRHRPSVTVDFLSLRLKINCTCAAATCSHHENAVVQSFVIDAPAIELTLQILMTIDAELGRIGKIGAEAFHRGAAQSFLGFK